MGMFDYVTTNRPEFVCSEGHDLNGAEFQTKDLGETMGHSVIGETLEFGDGGWGGKDPIPRPFTDTIEIYADCKQCPALVQAGTFNLVPTGVAFEIRIEADRVVSVRRTSADTGPQLEAEARRRYMHDCRGPMPYSDAHRRHIDRAFFPWDPIPTVTPEERAAQEEWRAGIDAFSKRRGAMAGSLKGAK